MLKLSFCLTLLSYYAVQAEFPPAEFEKALRPLRDTCLTKSGTTDVVIKNFIAHPTPDKRDEKLNAYMICVLRELNLIDANENVLLKQLYPMFPDGVREFSINMGKDCEPLQGKTLKDRVWWLHQCWKKADPAHYFIV